MSTVTDLVVRKPESEAVASNGSDVIAQVVDELPSLVNAEDIEGILMFVSKGEGARAYAEAEGLEEEARRLLKLLFHCWASIGLVDVRQHPRLPGRGGPLMLHGKEIASRSRRCEWRRLAVVADRGLLDRAMNEWLGDGIGSGSALDIRIGREGLLMVPATMFSGKLSELRGTGSSRGTISHFANENGINRAKVEKIAKGQVKGMQWWSAKRYAEALGMDPMELPVYGLAGRRKPRKRTWVHRKIKATGGTWDEFNVRVQRVVDELVRLSNDSGDQNNLAYEAAYTLRDFGRKKALKSTPEIRAAEGSQP